MTNYIYCPKCKTLYDQYTIPVPIGDRSLPIGDYLCPNCYDIISIRDDFDSTINHKPVKVTYSLIIELDIYG